MEELDEICTALDAFDFSADLPDLDAFDLDGILDDALGNERYNRPRLRPPMTVSFEHAVEFAKQFEFSEGMRVFAFVSGNFIFGDFLECLVGMRKIDVKRLSIQTLSMSQDNIDSLANVREICGGFDELNLVLSDYWYAHERHANGLVPYLYEELDQGDGFRCAYAAIHTKICLIETKRGHKLVIHGSANLRSSRNVEYFCIEQDDALYDFIYDYQRRMLDAYDVVNKDAKRPKSVRGGDLWQAVAAKEAAEAAADAPTRRNAGAKAGTTF